MLIKLSGEVLVGTTSQDVWLFSNLMFYDQSTSNVWEEGEYISLSLRCHHQNDFYIKMGISISHFHKPQLLKWDDAELIRGPSLPVIGGVVWGLMSTDVLAYWGQTVRNSSVWLDKIIHLSLHHFKQWLKLTSWGGGGAVLIWVTMFRAPKLPVKKKKKRCGQEVIFAGKRRSTVTQL